MVKEFSSVEEAYKYGLSKGGKIGNVVLLNEWPARDLDGILDSLNSNARDSRIKSWEIFRCGLEIGWYEIEGLK